ncbi:hypothetical protein [Heyndrickxia shackletonii]|nr:hypothetical protein [Heyndrickxia shackletonii]
MSFIRGMKDKKAKGKAPDVVHRRDEGQKSQKKNSGSPSRNV